MFVCVYLRERSTDKQGQMIRQRECKTRNNLAHGLYINGNYYQMLRKEVPMFL